MGAFLNSMWKVWRTFGQKIGNGVARIFITLFYFTVFAPFGFGVRFFSDSLQIKGGGQSRWLNRETGDRTLKEARRLF
jgi:hypothetical protein